MQRRFGALLLGAVLLAACTTANPHANGPTPTTPTSTPVTRTTNPAPTTPRNGALVEDLSWVSPTHGWALVEHQSCGQSTCTDVLTTTNGGAAWSPVGSIDATGNGCTGCGTAGVSHIRFANDLDGYTFGPSLFVTTDGGSTWTQQSGPYVAALEPVGTDVMRIAYTRTGCPGPCDLTVQLASVGSSAWRPLTAAIQGDAVQLVRQGLEAYVAVYGNPAGGGNGRTVLMISQDDGTTWGQRADPCADVGGDEYDTTAIAAAPEGVLAVLCHDRLQAQRSYVEVSTDSGVVFSAGPVVPGGDVFDTIGATSATSLFLGTGAPGTGSEQWSLLASADGGRTWKTVASQTGQAQPFFPVDTYLGFQNSDTGRWVGYPYDVWMTTNGGSTWVRQAVGGAT